MRGPCPAVSFPEVMGLARRAARDRSPRAEPDEAFLLARARRGRRLRPSRRSCGGTSGACTRWPCASCVPTTWPTTWPRRRSCGPGGRSTASSSGGPFGALGLPDRREPRGQPRALAARARGGPARGPRARRPRATPARWAPCSTRRPRGCSTRRSRRCPPSSAPCSSCATVEEMSYEEIAEAPRHQPRHGDEPALPRPRDASPRALAPYLGAGRPRGREVRRERARAASGCRPTSTASCPPDERPRSRRTSRPAPSARLSLAEHGGGGRVRCRERPADAPPGATSTTFAARVRARVGRGAGRRDACRAVCRPGRGPPPPRCCSPSSRR